MYRKYFYNEKPNTRKSIRYYIADKTPKRDLQHPYMLICS